MPELTLIYGPMNAGKTLCLKEMKKVYGDKAIIYDCPHNTRNSERDLKSEKFTFTFQSGYDVLIFDEVHLYTVFKTEEKFLQCLSQIKCKHIICAGVLFDCYNKFKQFSIWEKLILLPNITSLECRPMYSIAPCYNCGSYHNIFFSINTKGNQTTCVGDHYRNICQNCVKDVLCTK